MNQQLFWHTKELPEIFNKLQSNKHGLTKEEAKKRLFKYGENKLPERKAEGVLVTFLKQFQNSLIYILLVATGILFFMGDTVDALIIFVLLTFNAVVGTTQESKAQNTLLALKRLTETSTIVLRDGKEFVIPDTEVTIGDIITLQEGSKVPADARIIASNTLKVNEASLTGESEPITKNSSVLLSENLPIADQKNMLFKGTHILSGNGTAIVIATGFATEIGKIAQKISTIETEVPLKANIRYLSHVIIIIVAIINVFLFAIGIFSGRQMLEILSTIVALSVSVIPEGLPIVMTLILSTGVWRMSKRNVLVKRLQAVETLGQTKIIAVDKTGTLTKNEMMLQYIFVDGKSFEITGDGYKPTGDVIFDGKIIDPLNYPELLLSGKIASYCVKSRLYFSEEARAWMATGDPTETAMLVFSEKIGFRNDTLEQETPKIFEIPFDYQKKYHGTIRIVDGKNFLTVIGAPEKVLELCKNIWHKDTIDTLTYEKKKELKTIFMKSAQKGFRVVAYAINTDTKESLGEGVMPPLTFVGFFSMNDALRSKIKESVKKVQTAGMRIVMITGDHRLTAQAVAKEAGIWHEGDNILTGEEIDSLSDKELAKTLASTSVFARVSPNHKLRIIQAYRERGEVVAMTGDGVNDAPSLIAADLGVSMGKIGTEVAKEASDIVLLDDNFANIVSAAEEGRAIYKTIKKVILYLFSTSLGEVSVIIIALILGYPLPLLAAQIIWLNFVTDGFLDIALSMEPKESGLMDGKFERPKKWIIDRLMTQRIFLMALPMTVGTLYLFSSYFETDLNKALTISLTTMAVFQWFNAWNCKSESKSIFQTNPFSNMYLVGATAIVVFLQIVAIYTPLLQKILHTTPISLNEWATIIMIASSIVLIEELRKFFYRRKI